MAMDDAARCRMPSEAPRKIGKTIKTVLASTGFRRMRRRDHGTFGGKTLWAVIAHQRCGTNFFESMLRTIPGVHHFPEILYPAFFDGSFYAYYAELIRKEPRYLLLTDFTLVDAVFRGYFEHQVRAIRHDFIGFDLKIDQLDCYPRLYHSLKAWGFRIIHLRRENRLRRVISHLVMLRRLKTGREDIHRTPPKLIRMQVDCADVVRQIKEDMRGDARVESRLGRGNRRYLQLSYETLVHERRQTLGKATGFLGLDADVAGIEPDTVQQSRWPLEEVVTNYAELRRALKRSNLHYDLD